VSIGSSDGRVPHGLPVLGAIDRLRGLMAMAVNVLRFTRGQAVAKHAFDVVVSGAGLVLLAPAFLAIAVAIKLISPGPILFRQERVGLHRRPFMVLKFRTMVVDARMLAELRSRNEADGPLFKLRDDPHVTKAGAGYDATGSTSWLSCGMCYGAR
jgi:lipopolysaccharide/colanic/teichoic acid biosynthesis glycosyltransferase